MAAPWSRDPFGTLQGSHTDPIEENLPGKPQHSFNDRYTAQSCCSFPPGGTRLYVYLFMPHLWSQILSPFWEHERQVLTMRKLSGPFILR